jgi:N-acetylglucosamine malate deacetylase 1
MERVLVVAPHPDDECIGCGGAICLHRSRGDRVVVVFLTSGEHALKHLAREAAWQLREHEAAVAARVLDLNSVVFLRRADWHLGDDIQGGTEALRPLIEQEQPTVMYLPHEHEWHPDHRACAPMVHSALLGANHRPSSLRSYEVWTPLREYDVVEDVSSVMRRKLQALRCYHSQLSHFRYDRAIRGLNQYRGELAGRCRYAEVFQTTGEASTRPE